MFKQPSLGRFSRFRVTFGLRLIQIGGGFDASVREALTGTEESTSIFSLSTSGPAETHGSRRKWSGRVRCLFESD